MLKNSTQTVFFSASPAPWKTTSDFCFWNAGPFSLIFFQCKCFLLDVLLNRWTRLADIWSLGSLIFHRFPPFFCLFSYLLLDVFYPFYCYFFVCQKIKKMKRYLQNAEKISLLPKLQIRLWDSRANRPCCSGRNRIHLLDSRCSILLYTNSDVSWRGEKDCPSCISSYEWIWEGSNRLLSQRDLLL